jgi:hypothetical protein
MVNRLYASRHFSLQGSLRAMANGKKQNLTQRTGRKKCLPRIYADEHGSSKFLCGEFLPQGVTFLAFLSSMW